MGDRLNGRRIYLGDLGADVVNYAWTLRQFLEKRKANVTQGERVVTDDHGPASMKNWSDARGAIAEALLGFELIVMVVGHQSTRRLKSGKTATELEIRGAQARKIPIIAFARGEDTATAEDRGTSGYLEWESTRRRIRENASLWLEFESMEQFQQKLVELESTIKEKGIVSLGPAEPASAQTPTPPTVSQVKVEYTLEVPPWEGRKTALHAVADLPLDDDSLDRLEFRDYAAALATLIDHPQTKAPLVVAVNAPWGAGKTTLGGMVQRQLNSQPATGGRRPHTTAWFNAWMHDEAENVIPALLATTVRLAHASRPAGERLLTALPAPFLSSKDRRRRRAWNFALSGAFIVAIAALVAVLLVHKGYLVGPATEADQVVAAKLAVLGVLSAGAIWVANLVASYLPNLVAFIRNPSLEATRGTLGETRAELWKLLDEAVPAPSKLVVFIDDLDRCKPHNAVRVLEAVNQLLSHERTIVVILADMETLAADVEIVYEPLQQKHEEPYQALDLSFGRSYVQKIVQLQFDLPRQSAKTIRDLINQLGEPTPQPSIEMPSFLGGFWKWLSRLRHGLVREFRNLPASTKDAAWLPFVETWRRWKAHQSRRRLGRLMADVGRVLAWPTLAVQSATRSLFLPRSVRSAFGKEPGFLRSLAVFAIPFCLFAIAALPLSLNPQKQTVGFAFSVLLPLLAFLGLWLWMTMVAAAIGVVTGIVHGVVVRRTLSRELTNLARAASPEGAAPKGSALRAIAEQQATTAARKRYADVVTDSEALGAAMGEVLHHLPTLPRHAKRIVNQLRLQVFLAYQKGAIAPGTMARPPHFGKWVVLQERWPRVATRLSNKAELFPLIEAAAVTKESFGLFLSEQGFSIAEPETLRNFLERAPRLGPVAASLVRFEAVAAAG